MAPHSCSSDDNVVRCIPNHEVLLIEEQMEETINNVGLELHSFKISWYNSLVEPEYLLNYHGDSLAFVVVSTPSMFEKAFLPFLANCNLEWSSVCSDPIDSCMQHYFEELKQKLSSIAESPIETIHDFEMHLPQRRPKILLQTAAHISGAAYYYKMQTAKQRLGVCIHPTFGGWFGIRGVFIFPQLLATDLSPKQPKDVVPQEKRAELLHLFNERWRDMTYRNIIPVQSRYSPLQIEYFSLKPRDRMEFLRSKVGPLLGQFKHSPDLSNDPPHHERVDLSM